jgi:homospermidine synthase
MFISPSTKLIFLGYGAVAKCVWSYFPRYFQIEPHQVHLVDKTISAFRGPRLNGVNVWEWHIDAISIHALFHEIGVSERDIVIDLTFSSATYSFIHACLLRGLVYINTSIEDQSDIFSGRSIAYQQQYVEQMCVDFEKSSGIKASILTECGQNPGLIQHYVLNALHELNVMSNPLSKGDYSRETLTKVIDQYRIGSILMSEIDGLTTTRPMKEKCLYNTWSVAGFMCEALDSVEVVRGTDNPYIQPELENKHPLLNTLFSPYQTGTDVVFLESTGLNTYLPSICPTLVNGHIQFTNFQGRLIHHGEIFELARYFGPNAPFMSYVYQNSPYMDQSMNTFSCDPSELKILINDPSSFCVFDNIGMSPEQRMKGFDSIGCTLFCGTDSIDHIYWCGSVISDEDTKEVPEFSPTIVQVAAGVLSGLSYILEPTTSPKFYQPSNVPTPYMIEKAQPLLGKFFFTEIPIDLFSNELRIQVK